VILAALVKFAGGGFREVEAMDVSQARFWNNAAAELEKRIAEEVGAG
jgi:hypothetical protein